MEFLINLNNIPFLVNLLGTNYLFYFVFPITIVLGIIIPWKIIYKHLELKQASQDTHDRFANFFGLFSLFLTGFVLFFIGINIKPNPKSDICYKEVIEYTTTHSSWFRLRELEKMLKQYNEKLLIAKNYNSNDKGSIEQSIEYVNMDIEQQKKPVTLSFKSEKMVINGKEDTYLLNKNLNLESMDSWSQMKQLSDNKILKYKYSEVTCSDTFVSYAKKQKELDKISLAK